MKYVLIAILGLIIFNGVFVLWRVKEAEGRANRNKLEYPNRINIRR